jgi:hypothetical protein
VVDAGWWPRSWDPLAELPGLIVALSDQYGAIRQVMLNSGTWKGQFRRLTVGGAAIRIGWFASLDPAVLVATTEAGDQIDVLVVPPETTAAAADLAMTGTADPTDTRPAPERLAALVASTANPGAEPDESAVFDNDGGRVCTSHPQRPQARVSTAIRIDLAY